MSSTRIHVQHDVPVKAHSSAAAEPALNFQSGYNALSIDVEDYFQVEAFSKTIGRESWDHLPRRINRNTEKLLELLADAEVHSTFFMLGWVAKRHPELVRRIVAEGHELASHGSEHRRADQQEPQDFRNDVSDSKHLLEDISGIAVSGYRAPTFSIGPQNMWAHAILAEEGYRYSSSIYPRGRASAASSLQPFSPSPGIVEVPLATVSLLGINVPASGGGYFRLFPYRFSTWLLAQAAKANATPTVFYIHPWEIDPEQPRQSAAPALSRFRHYFNLEHTENRLRRLLRQFKWTRIDTAFFGPHTSSSSVSEWMVQ